jgi:hypothetical protein
VCEIRDDMKIQGIDYKYSDVEDGFETVSNCDQLINLVTFLVTKGIKIIDWSDEKITDVEFVKSEITALFTYESASGMDTYKGDDIVFSAYTGHGKFKLWEPAAEVFISESILKKVNLL